LNASAENAAVPVVVVNLPSLAAYDEITVSVEQPHETIDKIDAARIDLLLANCVCPASSPSGPPCATADKEGWPAARFLAALAEQEMVERSRRRFERHLGEARLPPGKTLDAFDFDAVPMISKAQVQALAAGDAWLEKGANLCVCLPGGGKSHLAAALGMALIEKGWRVLFTRTTDLVQNSRSRAVISPRSGDRQTRQISPADFGRSCLCHQGSSRDQRFVRADQRPLRAAIDAHHR
jgi:hypothetical protein